ncbi:putative Cell division control protein 16 [Blattamonas nauphoetae]|uniref:Cell division control protein 16 n=1 Tax=Blattamonas nauphoetae TaxID=2049346 RepID=A0ABQ9XM28_9EUKA|nr:putative Cell division control protein 16 [Blattamonas nauphoetae]
MSVAEFRELIDPKNPKDSEEVLKELRKMVILKGLPDQDGLECDREDGLRGTIWKIFLRIPSIDSQKYLALVAQKKCKFGDKIRDDTFRTVIKDDKFKQGVAEVKLVRVLNAYVHSISDSDSKMPYVQGMSLILAPFIYVMPEVDAFFCYSRLLQYFCPNYVLPALEGVHAATDLLDEVLKVADNELFTYLKERFMIAKLYAFSPLMSFMADTLPVNELLQIWDFLLAYGMHLNVLCVAAQHILIRDVIFRDTKNAISKLKDLPELRTIPAKQLITKAIEIAKGLPEDLYTKLVRHPWDPLMVRKK